MKKYFLIIIACILTSSLFGQTVVELANALHIIKNPNTIYDPSYVKIPYPNGDVPANKGVCTDVIIRAYREIGIDLQKEVHEDMKKNFNLYPSKRIWGLTAPDTNIDHRRVPNLMKFFERHGEVLPITDNPKNYTQGDIVCWKLSNGLLHIGIVSNIVAFNRKGELTDENLILHNIGFGTNLDKILFAWKIIGHYRYKVRVK